MTPCTLWQGYINKDGYGRLGGRGAHRLAYERERGPIPPGLTLDHLCRNRACVNTAHLEPVTRKVNSLRGVGACAANARKTHCKHGHPFDEANTYRRHEWRSCRSCNRAAVRRLRLRRSDS